MVGVLTADKAKQAVPQVGHTCRRLFRLWRQLQRERARWLYDIKTTLSVELHRKRMDEYANLSKILMALSNDTGALVLTTGNKSELAVGYCTLYGDMAGGLAVIGDLPKTLVYRVSRAANARAGRELIPERTFTKPPSAELKPDQKDEDSLPAYPVLDTILKGLIERDLSAVRPGDPVDLVDKEDHRPLRVLGLT